MYFKSFLIQNFERFPFFSLSCVWLTFSLICYKNSKIFKRISFFHEQWWPLYVCWKDIIIYTPKNADVCMYAPNMAFKYFSLFQSSLVEKVGRLKMYALKRANLVRGRCRIFYINFLDYIPICKTSSLIWAMKCNFSPSYTLWLPDPTRPTDRQTEGSLGSYTSNKTKYSKSNALTDDRWAKLSVEVALCRTFAMHKTEKQHT